MKTSLGATIIALPTPVWVIGTYDEGDRANVMTAAWGGVCCSKPPCVNFSLRQATHTYGLVKANKAFTVNLPSADQVGEADWYGMTSGRDHDKLAESGLTPVASDLVRAPYIAEFPLVLECRLIHHHEIGLHTLFIGEVVDVKADRSILDDKGKPRTDKLRPITYIPALQEYRALGKCLGLAFDVGKR